MSSGHFVPLSQHDTLAIFDHYCNPGLGVLPIDECRPIVGIKSPVSILREGLELPDTMDQPTWSRMKLTHELASDALGSS